MDFWQNARFLKGNDSDPNQSNKWTLTKMDEEAYNSEIPTRYGATYQKKKLRKSKSTEPNKIIQHLYLIMYSST